MARTKGALNKRTRAALSDAELGALGNDTLEFVDRFRKDTRKDDQQRLRAADIVLTYTKPKLSAIEQHMVDDATKYPRLSYWVALYPSYSLILRLANKSLSAAAPARRYGLRMQKGR